jgi:predicted exporter
VKRGRLAAAGIWLVLALAAGVIAARATYVTDLSAFLPATPSAAQQLLVDQLREGPASRLVLVAISGADADARARLSNALAARLLGDPAIATVDNGAAAALERDRRFIFEHRYLLSSAVTPQRFTTAGLAAAIADSVDLIASPVGLVARDLLPHDPTGETLEVIGALAGGAGPRKAAGVFASRDGRRALLLVKIRALGSDIDGQERAVAAIRAAFAAVLAAGPGSPRADVALELSGPAVFAVEARATIKREVLQLSILGAALVATLLLAVYRSFRTLALGLLPVASGALAGVAAVALGFGVVHGVTLGFGVTLIGESVDYAIYLFVQGRDADGRQADADRWTRTLWPVVRLGMLTSVCGFASLLPATFPGLAQLGLYSIAGLVAAALTTRFVLPQLLGAVPPPRPVAPLGAAVSRVLGAARRRRALLWVVPVAAVLVLAAHRDRLWSHELASLSPVSAAAQALDASLRTDLGAPDASHLVVLSGVDPESLLEAAERVSAALEPLVAAGTLAGFDSPSRYLPSHAAQQRRRDSLPAAAELHARLGAALKGLPLRAAALEPFERDVEAARSEPLVTRADLEATSLGAGLDALLSQRGDRWVALLPLQAPATGARAFAIDLTSVERAVGTATPAGITGVVLDLKREADALYGGYRRQATRLSLAGLAAIVLLLAVALRSTRRALAVVLPLVLAVLVVTAAFALAGRPLTILHLVGLLLIVAVGSNYALFFDREARLEGEDREASQRLLASLCIANLTTVIAFGVLGLSTVPVLSALGTTVAPGALLALLFSALLAGPAAASSGRS